MESTYDCKSQQNATLTRQEEEGDIQLKVQVYLSFVLIYFDFWSILAHGSFDNSSNFVHVNINILTQTTSGPPVVNFIFFSLLKRPKLNIANFETQDSSQILRVYFVGVFAVHTLTGT